LTGVEETVRLQEFATDRTLSSWTRCRIRFGRVKVQAAGTTPVILWPLQERCRSWIKCRITTWVSG